MIKAQPKAIKRWVGVEFGVYFGDKPKVIKIPRLRKDGSDVYTETFFGTDGIHVKYMNRTVFYVPYDNLAYYKNHEWGPI